MWLWFCCSDCAREKKKKKTRRTSALFSLLKQKASKGRGGGTESIIPQRAGLLCSLRRPFFFIIFLSPSSLLLHHRHFTFRSLTVLLKSFWIRGLLDLCLLPRPILLCLIILLPFPFTPVMMYLIHRTVNIAFHILPFILVYFCLGNSPSVSAATPPAVYKPQTATLNDTLYIQGGTPGGQYASSEFYSLSLSKPWNDTAPPWKTLPTSTSGVDAPHTYFVSMAISADRSTLVEFDFNSPDLSFSFNVLRKTWYKSPLPVTLNVRQIFGLHAMADPKSDGLGTFYVPNGCPDMSTNTTVWYMCKYNLNTVNVTATPLPMPAQLEGVIDYSIALITARDSLFIYGGQTFVDGNRGPFASANLFLYDIVNLAWRLVVSWQVSIVLQNHRRNPEKRGQNRFFLTFFS